jgi:Right handed beta helix region/Dockerin type I domain/Bacterial Ig-like domain (group 2)
MTRLGPSVPVHASTLAAMIALATGAPSVAAGQGIPVTVGVGAISTGAAQFDLPVVADMSARTEKLGSFVMTVRWNPSVLQFVGGIDGTFGSLVVNEDSVTAGVITLSGANPAGVSGLVTLGVGRFQVLTNDTTTFRVSVQELFAAGTFADLTSAAVALDRVFCGALAGTYGDVNQDGAVNGADALIVLTESVGLDVSQYAVGFGDVDDNGVRNPRDALIILSYAVGINTSSFRAGQSVSGNVCVPPGAETYGLNPAVAAALTGQHIRYFAFGLDSTGAALALRNVTWTSSNAAVATVDVTGEAIAVGSGTTTITALQNDSAIATGSLSVAATRKTHWVDALASQARNQLGTASLPYGTLADALAAAAAGDTVRVRSGRYAGGGILTPIVVMGDTSAGGTRPWLVADQAIDTVLTVRTPGSVVLRDLQVDTAYVGIHVRNTDTLRLVHVDVRGQDQGLAAVYLDSVGLATFTRVVLAGHPGQAYYYGIGGLQAYGVASLVLDSSAVLDFDADGVYTSEVDTLTVRHTTVRDNYGYGIRVFTSDTTDATQLTMSHDQLVQNYNGGVYASYVGNAAFDHNVFVGYGYVGADLYGSRGSVVSVVGDTARVTNGPWLSIDQYDSVLVDSVVVPQVDYQSYLNNGRVTVVRNSAFQDVRTDALVITGRGVDSSTALVRNSDFGGDLFSGYSGTGLSPYSVTLDVEDSRFDGVYYGVYAYYSTVHLRRTSITGAGYGLYASCAYDASVDTVLVKNTDYAIYGSGCAAAGALDVDSLDVQGGYQGVYASTWASANIRNSRFTDIAYGLSLQTVHALVRGVQVATQYGGVDASPDSTATIVGNAVTCATGSTAYGIEAGNLVGATIDSNTVSGDCGTAIYAYAVDTLGMRGNVIGASQTGYADHGIESYTNAPGRRVIVGNSITGPWRYGSIYAYDSTYVRVDSNVVNGGIEAGVWVDRGDTVLVRGNTVDRILDASCCGTYTTAGILLAPLEASGARREVQYNRVTRSANGLLLFGGAADTVTVQLDSNNVYGSVGSGVVLQTYARVLARKNTIDSSGVDGVHVDRTIVGDATVQFEQNNITRSTAYGVRNLDGGAILAQNNWWGDALGPAGTAGAVGSTGDSVSAGVTWDPQLGSPTDGFMAPPPFVAGGAARAAALAVGVRHARSRPTPQPAPLVSERPVTTPSNRERHVYPDGQRGAEVRESDRLLRTRGTEWQERLRQLLAERAAEAQRVADRERARAAARVPTRGQKERRP